MSFRVQQNYSKELGAVLEQATQGKQITPEGRDYAKLRFDPCHDYQLTPAGYPDADGSPTLVEKYTTSATVSHPSTQTSGNWSCLVFNNPVVDSTYTDGISINGMGAFHTNASADIIARDSSILTGNMQLEGFTILKMADGTGHRFFPGEGSTAWPHAASHFESQSLRACPAALRNKRMRLIAQGFQVHNTTAEVYQQGACTTGMVAQTNQMDINRYVELNETNDGVKHHAQLNVWRAVCPPATVEEAMEYPNVEKWKAAEGCYARVGFNGIDQPMERAEARCLRYDCHDSNQTGPTVQNGTCMVSSFNDRASLTPVQICAFPVQSVFANTNCTFAYFSGLSFETTLEVTGRSFIEVAPRAGDALLPVATPGAPYDPKVLQLIAAVETKIPIAVPVAFNDAGRYARMVAHEVGGALAKFAPIVGAIASPFVGPEAGALGAAIGAAGGAVAAGTRRKKNTAQKMVVKR
jgi:hypothetical protein